MTTNPRKRAHSHSPAPSSGDADAGDGDGAGVGDHEIHEYPDYAYRAPKRLRRLAVRSASLPTAAIAVRNRRAERQARRKRERAAALQKAAAVGAGMEVG